MANPDQKTILIDNALEEIKNICINLQKDTDASNSELKGCEYWQKNRTIFSPEAS